MRSRIPTSEDLAAPSTIAIVWWKKLLFSLVVFTIFLLLLEGLLRIFHLPREAETLRTDPGIYQPRGPALRFSYTPGWSGYLAGAQVHINSAGWRGREFSPEKPQGTRRILGIGDSFTFGRAVND